MEYCAEFVRYQLQLYPRSQRRSWTLILDLSKTLVGMIWPSSYGRKWGHLGGVVAIIKLSLCRLDHFNGVETDQAWVRSISQHASDKIHPTGVLLYLPASLHPPLRKTQEVNFISNWQSHPAGEFNLLHLALVVDQNTLGGCCSRACKWDQLVLIVLK